MALTHNHFVRDQGSVRTASRIDQRAPRGIRWITGGWAWLFETTTSGGACLDGAGWPGTAYIYNLHCTGYREASRAGERGDEHRLIAATQPHAGGTTRRAVLRHRRHQQKAGCIPLNENGHLVAGRPFTEALLTASRPQEAGPLLPPARRLYRRAARRQEFVPVLRRAGTGPSSVFLPYLGRAATLDGHLTRRFQILPKKKPPSREAR